MTTYTYAEYDDVDYAAVDRIARAIRPDEFTSVADLREWDEMQREAGRRSGRWLAAVDGEIVGSAYLGESPWRDAAHPSGSVSVHPEHERRGIGRQLLERIEGTARQWGAADLRTWAEEDRARSIRFLEAAGYEEADREWRSTLDLTTFDPGAWSATLDRLAESGVKIVSFAELQGGQDGWLEDLYDLYSAVESDVPAAVPLHAVARQDWEAITLGRRMLPEGFLIAIDDEGMIGLTEPQRVDDDEHAIAQELTGVARRARGRGVATALKAAAAIWAKQAGYTSIRTYNAQANAPMLAVNDKLGFTRDHGSIEFRKDL
jgi:GNAT superfamily N-acetyltransferase